MSDWTGIDLLGRTMLHSPWCRSRTTSEQFFCPAKTIIEIVTAFKDAGGVVNELVQLLNKKMPPGAEQLDENEIIKADKSYSLEFQFYVVQFTKQLLNDPSFCYETSDDSLLSIHHLVYEKGSTEFPPWIIDDGGVNDGYLSITNLSAMFLYLEEKYECDSIDGDSRELGRRLSGEALGFLNRCIPENYQADRSFYEKEGILISYEYLCYGGEILRALTNEEMILINSYYYSFLHHNQLARAIFLQPELSPVEGFMEWQRRTNNIHKMEFRTRGRTLWIKLDFSSMVKIGMIFRYRKSMIKRLQEGAPIVHRAFLELATGKKVKIDLIYDKNNDLTLTVKLRWRSPSSSANIYVAAMLSILIMIAVSVAGRFFMPQQINFLVTTAVSALIVGSVSALASYWRNKLNATRNRFKSLKDVIDNQLITLKNTTNELLRERDLLDKKVIERTTKLNEALEQLQDLDRSKTNFIANISHELRTPLTLISVPLEGIKSGRYGETLSMDHQVFQLVERNVKRLNNHINQLLDFSKLDLGKMNFVPVPIDVLGFCSLLIAELESIAQRKGLSLEIENRTGEEQLVIQADNKLLETTVLNLLNNALKFTNKGGIKLIFSYRADDKIVLTVKDSGIGFSAEENDRIFKRFTQAEEHKGRHHEGSGIGLALVNEITEIHGWTIEVEGHQGKGASFSVIMPLLDVSHSVHPQSGLNPEFRNRRHERAESGLSLSKADAVEISSSKKETILLIEDNPDMGNVLQNLLRDDYNIHWCSDGSDALFFLESSQQISLILCDVMMPMIDGFSFRKELLKQPEYKNIPFIFLTALGDSEDKREGLKSGAVDYIQKPFDASELVLKVKNLIDSHRASYLQATRDQQGMERLHQFSTIETKELYEKNWSLYGITMAERRIVELVRQGLQDKEIAMKLSLSPRTVSSHLSHLFQKTDTQNRIELINLIYK